jgi:toxin ParE1/3/4
VTRRFRISRAAENDLRRIWRETAQERGEAQAERYLRSLDASFHHLGDYPDMGHRYDGPRPLYRCFPKGEHHIYYRVEAAGVLIVRIRPQRMLPPALAREEGGTPS